MTQNALALAVSELRQGLGHAAAAPRSYKIADVARVWMVTALVLASLASGVAQQPVFRGGTDLVSFGVVVTDRRGNFLTDLTGDDFEIIEDSKPQAVKYFVRGQGDVAPELHIGLLLDTSGSMLKDIGLARTAAIRFLNALPEARDITLVDFDTEVRLARYGQDDFPRIVERIRSRKPEGFTAMYDALGQYLNVTELGRGRNVLVLFTDGGDTRSALGFADIMTLLRASDVTVYPIGFVENQSSSVRSLQRSRLQQMADESGGQAFFPLSMKEIEAAYEKILVQVRAQYTVGYVSTNTARDGSWRKVEIRITRPDLKDVRVQTRKGYFGLYQAAR